MNEKFYTAQTDAKAFEKVHLKLRGPIEQCVFFLTGTRQDSEDVAQEIFIKLWINWAKLQLMSDEDLKYYALTVLKNHIRNERKRNSRPKRNKNHFLKEYLMMHPDYFLHDDILMKEGIKLHREAINQLPEKTKAAYLFHMDDQSLIEVARSLNRSRQTIYNQLHSAKNFVTGYLNKNYELNMPTPGEKNGYKQASLN